MSVNFPKIEQEVLSHWADINAFELSRELSKGKPEYIFFDGPPFATGTPHYGHILAGTIKDVVCRYWYMNGRNVNRRFGWDTHGLPIEFEINKLHDISTTAQVLEMGIAKYNALCREVVMRCAEDWRRTVTRLGRWIDYDDDNRTLYPSYMESLWSVFSMLWDKELVYRGEKVMAYSTACATPLSNFEANLDYRDRFDPEAYVCFQSADDPALSFVAWTTTPWTLPSNLALCVHPELLYAEVKDTHSDRRFILLQSRIPAVFSEHTSPTLSHTEVLRSMPGQALVGQRYRPLFPYFVAAFGDTAFRVVSDLYVKEDSGTGVVHQAPAFGEDDFRVCLANNVIARHAKLPCPLDANAIFTAEVPDLQGVQVFDANPVILRMLGESRNLLRSGSLCHSYPHCWRSDTPLIYRAIPCWFVRVESLRDRLLANNAKTRWVPEAIKTRFDNWLASTTDWAVSRNRFWGTPLPVWTNDDFTDMVCVRSIDHLEQLSGVRVTDLHRESVDDIVVKSPKTGLPLKRISEVFDCWYESGAMPYAQAHYPFDVDTDKFLENFPADFVAEGLDQTRGWFYTLLVLSTALFDRPAFKNVIVNGLVLAADGKKMSKRLKNYPDPELMLDKFGADAVRLYLINSPLLRAEETRFRQEKLNDVCQEVFKPWYNSYIFFSVACDEFRGAQGRSFVPCFDLARQSSNTMDRWILSSLQSLIKLTRHEMESYRLYKVTPHLVQFIDLLTNWYVRFNRNRLKGLGNILADQLAALNTLLEVLLVLCRLMAPITPFLTEHLYQKLSLFLETSSSASSASSAASNEDAARKSVHFQPFPEFQESLINTDIENVMSVFREVIITGRRLRDRNNKPIKFPLFEVVVLSDNDALVESLKSEVSEYILSELNVFSLTIKNDMNLVQRTIVPNAQSLGRKKGEYMKRVRASWGELDSKISKAKVTETQQAIDLALTQLPEHAVRQFEASGSLTLQPFGIELTHQDVVFVSRYADQSAPSPSSSSSAASLWAADSAGPGLVVAMNLTVNKDLQDEAIVRELMSNAQLLRKAGG
ncbi:MAG: isoleucine--tRNA ligase, partial [archaeon]|nr:isoleucine--tRNA ligase [archaeon]